MKPLKCTKYQSYSGTDLGDCKAFWPSFFSGHQQRFGIRKKRKHWTVTRYHFQSAQLRYGPNSTAVRHHFCACEWLLARIKRRMPNDTTSRKVQQQKEVEKQQQVEKSKNAKSQKLQRNSTSQKVQLSQTMEQTRNKHDNHRRMRKLSKFGQPSLRPRFWGVRLTGRPTQAKNI